MARGVAFLALLFSSLLAIGPCAWGGIDEDLALVRERIQQLDPQDSADSQLHDTYQKALNALQSALQYRDKAEQLRQRLKQQPREIEALRESLEQPPEIQTIKGLEQMDIKALEQAGNAKKTELVTLQQEQTRLDNQIKLNEQKLISLPEQINTLKQQINSATETSGQNEAESALINGEFAKANARVQALEMELLALPDQSEQANLQLQRLNRDIRTRQPLLQLIEERLQERRRTDAEQALSELEQHPQEATHPLLADASRTNRQLGDQLRQLIADTENTSRQRQALEKQLEQIRERYHSIDEQLQLDAGYVGIELRRLLFGLAKGLDTKPTRTRLNKMRLRNLELNRALLQLRNTQLDPTTKPPLSDTQRKKRDALLQDQQELMSRVRASRQQLINELSQLLAIEGQVNGQRGRNRELLNKNLFWIPSMAAIDRQWLQDIPAGLAYLKRSHSSWGEMNLWQLHETAGKILVGFILAGIVALWLNRYQRQHSPLWHRQLGNVRHDRLTHSLWLLLAGALIALPLPLLLYTLANHGVNPSHPLHLPLALTLKTAALSVWFYHSMLNWMRLPDGLFGAHFGINVRLIRLLRKRMTALFILATPCLLLLIYTQLMDNQPLRSGMLRLTLMVVALLLMLFWASLMPVAQQLNLLNKNPRWWKKSEIWLAFMSLFNLALLGLMGWGYVFTAVLSLIMATRVVAIGLALLIYFRMGLHWLLIEERKLAFSRALERRAEIMEAREHHENPPPLKEDYLDLQTISEQARLLLKVTALALLALMLWLFVGDLLPSLQVLEMVAIWPGQTDATEGGPLILITLANLMGGLLVLTLSLLAAFNLPGILELLVLRHLSLGPGTNYAISSLLKYLLILIGLLMGFREFGVEWQSLQWLVAALGVGLGFGLQEIVANFISGLIILFEKPVRIGDTITVGNLTGTVTRIQIRATTITDWDRKEVIIPNKAFITGQLVNWSLSDAITRVVVRVGIAYGSDIQQARKLLLAVAADNPKVQLDPAPEAFFIEFGGSTLNFELRIYVNNMTDRMQVTDEVNSRIAELFRQHDIEIAFPQMDIHISNNPNAAT